MKSSARFILLIALALEALFMCGLLVWLITPSFGAWMCNRFVGRRTVSNVPYETGSEARARLAPVFAHSGMAYPKQEFALLPFKRERRNESPPDQR